MQSMSMFIHFYFSFEGDWGRFPRPLKLCNCLTETGWTTNPTAPLGTETRWSSPPLVLFSVVLGQSGSIELGHVNCKYSFWTLLPSPFFTIPGYILWSPIADSCYPRWGSCPLWSVLFQSPPPCGTLVPLALPSQGDTTPHLLLGASSVFFGTFI